MNRTNEKGMALILTMILIAVLGAMAVSFMFLSQSETWSTMNYRIMNQARDAAEAGIQVAANFFVNTENDPNKYTAPATGGSDPITAYTTTSSPVRYSGNPVVLSADNSVTPNYPYSTAQSNYNTAAQGTLTAGNLTVNYSSYAELLALRQVSEYGGSNRTIQTWRINSKGSIGGVLGSQVEMEGILERPVQSTFNFAAFGTSPSCGSLNWAGSTSSTGSYDSTCILSTCPGTATYGGNVGSNGNLTEAGGATINGSLSTPRTGVGNCSAGNMTACTPSPCNVTEGINELPQTISFPPPAAPTPTPPTTIDRISNNGQCGTVPGCTIITSGSDYRLAPSCAATTGICPAGSTPLYGDLTLANSSNTFHICTGTYIVNSIALTAGATLVVDAGCGPIVFNVAGAGFSSNQYPIDFQGGAVSNPSLNPLNLQIQYAGTSNTRLSGGSTTALTLYAPNSNVTLAGGSSIYGSIIGSTVRNMGGTNLFYDRNLQDSAFTVGQYMFISWSWKKY